MHHDRGNPPPGWGPPPPPGGGRGGGARQPDHRAARAEARQALRRQQLELVDFGDLAPQAAAERAAILQAAPEARGSYMSQPSAPRAYMAGAFGGEGRSFYAPPNPAAGAAGGGGGGGDPVEALRRALAMYEDDAHRQQQLQK